MSEKWLTEEGLSERLGMLASTFTWDALNSGRIQAYKEHENKLGKLGKGSLFLEKARWVYMWITKRDEKVCTKICLPRDGDWDTDLNDLLRGQDPPPRGTHPRCRCEIRWGNRKEFEPSETQREIMGEILGYGKR